MAEFLGSILFDISFEVEGVTLSELSALAFEGNSYGSWSKRAYAVGDDGLLFRMTVDLDDGHLDEGDVVFTGVSFLRFPGYGWVDRLSRSSKS